MGTPITWQNITAPTFTDASAGLARAQLSLNSGFDAFNNVVKQQTEADSANWDQVKKNNTDAFMNKLLSTTSAEQFTALRDSGQLQQMLAANGAQIDQAAARSAMDQRLGTLQTQGTASIKYNDAVRADKDAPLLAQARALSLAGDYTGAAQIGTQLSQQSQAVLADDMDKRKRDLVTRSQTDNKAAGELRHWKAQEDSWAAQATHNQGMLGVSQGQLGVAQMNARTQANEAALRGQLAQAGRLEKQLEVVNGQIGNADAVATSNVGYGKVTDWVNKVDDKNVKARLTQALGEARTAGSLTGLTSSQVIAALQADIDTSQWQPFGGSTGNNLTAQLAKFRDPQSIAAAKDATDKETTLEKMRQDIFGRLYPGLLTPTPAAQGNLDAVNNPGAAAPGSAGTATSSPAVAANAPVAGNAVSVPAPVVNQSLAAQEAAIREKYATPEKYETVADRYFRTRNMQQELNALNATSPTTPFGRFLSEAARNGTDRQETENLRNTIISTFGPRSSITGAFIDQTDAERRAAKSFVTRALKASPAEMRQIAEEAGILKKQR